MTIKLCKQKKITLLKLLSTIMNLSILVSTTSHYSHLDYEFQISKPMYVLSMYIIKYKKIIVQIFKDLFPL